MRVNRESDSAIVKVRLANGVTVILDPDPRFNSTAYAVCLCGGLRGEVPGQAGLTHLLEHLLFKRTSQRDSLSIAGEIDELGGEINAFTDDDTLCLHGIVPVERSARMSSLLRELTLENAFNRLDFDREREVIRQEILDAQDDPFEVTYQRFAELFWPGDMLAYPVFGTVDTLEGLTADHARSRLAELLVGKRIVIAAAGKVDVDRVLSEVERSFGSLPPGLPESYRRPKTSAGLSQMPQSFGQIHFALGCPWAAFRDEAYLASLLLISVLGDGMSSRLFQRIREEHGLLYDIGAEADAYPDTGAMTISGAVEREKLQLVLELVLGEVDKVRQDLITQEELNRATALATAQLEMEQDSVSSRLWRAVETERIFGRYISAQETVQKLKAVTHEQIRNVVQTWLGDAAHPVEHLLVLAGDVEGLRLPDRILRACSLSPASPIKKSY